MVVRTSYHDLFDLPGGGMETGEDPRQAAIRELREETGVEAPPEALAAEGIYRYDDLGRRVTAHVFAYRPSEPPVPMIDRREIIWAGLLQRAELARSRVSPQLTAYLTALR